MKWNDDMGFFLFKTAFHVLRLRTEEFIKKFVIRD